MKERKPEPTARQHEASKPIAVAGNGYAPVMEEGYRVRRLPTLDELDRGVQEEDC